MKKKTQHLIWTFLGKLSQIQLLPCPGLNLATFMFVSFYPLLPPAVDANLGGMGSIYRHIPGG